MKKQTKRSTKSIDLSNSEAEIREIMRLFARNVLTSPKLRAQAAVEIGRKPSYVRALLDQRGIGGLNAWAPLMAFCFQQSGLSLVELLQRFLSTENFSNFHEGLTESERKFRSLDRISIVNEEIKLQLSTSLEMMLRDLEKSMRKK